MTGKRDLGIPKTMELTKRNGRWQASITFQKELPVRLKGQEVMAFDWGVSTYLSGVNQGFKPSSIEHPHFIRKSLLQIKQLGKKLSKQNRGSSGWRRTRAQISKVYQKLHDQRQNFTHQLSSELISNSQVIITEELGIKSMLEDHHLAQSKGLHRSIADSAVSGLLDKIRYKAEEAGVVFEEVPTRTLKPTQRCARCWKVTKKPLSQRVHDCSHCHFKVDRDYNAALVMMFYYYQKQGQELALWVEKLNRVLMKPATPPITRRV